MKLLTAAKPPCASVICFSISTPATLLGSSRVGAPLSSLSWPPMPRIQSPACPVATGSNPSLVGTPPDSWYIFSIAPSSTSG
ncbi:Uncharacterised protein [Mycobacterium tuberculosis]|nr:Uncharacterised protein [Mycobacterium tuberculosis]